jgi:mannose-6-phosphate isomerase class I
MRVYLLRNARMPKDWGSTVAIPDFLGEQASQTPLGELWMGAYPGSPSQLVEAGRAGPGLDVAIAADPEAWLGSEVARRFDGRLPFLFKVLAAETALSVQAHPSQDQARAGFEREEGQGVPRDAPERNYRDPRHKPELICALTPFTALARFREPGEIAARLAGVSVPELGSQLEQLRAEPDRAALRGLFEALMKLPDAPRLRLLERALEVAESSSDAAFAWVAKLHDQHPGDLGALAPLYLNLLTLEPGQALFLHACELHSYLSGLAVELMLAPARPAPACSSTRAPQRSSSCAACRSSPAPPSRAASGRPSRSRCVPGARAVCSGVAENSTSPRGRAWWRRRRCPVCASRAISSSMWRGLVYGRARRRRPRIRAEALPASPDRGAHDVLPRGGSPRRRAATRGVA